MLSVPLGSHQEINPAHGAESSTGKLAGPERVPPAGRPQGPARLRLVDSLSGRHALLKGASVGTSHRSHSPALAGRGLPLGLWVSASRGRRGPAGLGSRGARISLFRHKIAARVKPCAHSQPASSAGVSAPLCCHLPQGRIGPLPGWETLATGEGRTSLLQQKAGRAAPRDPLPSSSESEAASAAHNPLPNPIPAGHASSPTHHPGDKSQSSSKVSQPAPAEPRPASFLLKTPPPPPPPSSSTEHPEDESLSMTPWHVGPQALLPSHSRQRTREPPRSHGPPGGRTGQSQSLSWAPEDAAGKPTPGH